MTKNIKYFFSALLLSFFVFLSINFFQNNLDSYLAAQILGPTENLVSFEPQEKPKASVPGIEADAAISVKISPQGRQTILLDKNIEKPLPIASLTKLMTALVVMENPANFNFSDVITISKEAADQGNTPKYGNLTAGEKYTLEKLMELILVYSSNDGAFALSEIIGKDATIRRLDNAANFIQKQI